MLTELDYAMRTYELILVGSVFITASLGALFGWFISGRG